MRTLIGIVAYGGMNFLKLAVAQIKATANRNYDICVVIAKPGDREMKKWAQSEGCQTISHDRNNGFPASINDLCDRAWNCAGYGYDNLICMGNDVVPMPGALDAMMDFAETSNWDIVCASEFDVRFLVNTYSEARQFFHGDNLVFTDFTAKPWELHFNQSRLISDVVEEHCFKDVRNLTLFRRGAFNTVGYDDVNFWPNGYFADNDFCRRSILAGVRACGLRAAEFFHFWSRTIHQGENRKHSAFFQKNQEFYHEKWGGGVGQERFTLPFDGKPHRLAHDIHLPATLKIENRSQEWKIIRYWSTL